MPDSEDPGGSDQRDADHLLVEKAQAVHGSMEATGTDTSGEDIITGKK